MGDGILIKRMIDIQTTHVHRACVVPLECELNSTTHKARLRESTLKVNCLCALSLSRYPPVCVCTECSIQATATWPTTRATSASWVQTKRKLSSRTSVLLNCLFEEIEDILLIKI